MSDTRRPFWAIYPCRLYQLRNLDLYYVFLEHGAVVNGRIEDRGKKARHWREGKGLTV